MKKKFVALALILLTCTINFSCDGNRASQAKSLYNFKISLDSWNNLKHSNENSYSYTVSSRSVFGSGTNTSITVLDGKVTSRVYEAYTLYNEVSGNYLGFENRIVLEAYTESYETLGTHTSGAPALTIDELYNTCLSEYLSVDPDDNHVTFNYDSNNIIENCYYVPDGCMDDCAVGVSLSNFEWLTDNPVSIAHSKQENFN
ncbi:hypothetical protein RBH94_10920 [Aestuariibaculum sp. YM273]|uniref:hypothetical protein n=1 Tax=Aestuariibaculum sp. YM273 TaxID=3070659 RepID=UPI0027DE3FA6|nr:hypothetical protein [Aestuariibaculum sp. YM273]WMI64572.1 hypothetical protein RBH94_10920 [Aestuariibaculum sp. YM273]